MTKLELRTYFAAYELRIITLEQQFLELRYNHNHDDKGRFCSGGGGNSLDKSKKNDIIKSGGKITDKNFLKATEFEKQAEKFYEARIKNNDDVKAISKNTGFSEQDILAIKNHIMIEEHLFEDGTVRKFDPNIDQALAWQRMMNGNTKETDVLLLNHELRELKYMKKTNCDYETAHKFSSQKYDWNSDS